MTDARSSLVLGLVVLCLVATPATAKPTPAAKCLSAKLKAVAKKTAAKLACQAKAAQKGEPVDVDCLAKVETAFAKAFMKAESKPGCTTTSDASALEASVDEFVQSVVGTLPDGGTEDGGKCAGAKRKASGKYASASLLCQAKAATKAVAVNPECIDKAENVFTKAFGKAEQKGGCATVGDTGNLDQAVDAFIDQVLSQLSPAPATTTTTSPSTTSTTMGSAMPTVTVGPGDALVFLPAMLTIKVGDTVRWTWASSFHSVVSGQVSGAEMPDGKFCSPNDTNCASAPTSNTGATYDHTFTVAGTYPYFCAPHGTLGMVGTIVVEP